MQSKSRMAEKDALSSRSCATFSKICLGFSFMTMVLTAAGVAAIIIFPASLLDVASLLGGASNATMTNATAMGNATAMPSTTVASAIGK